MTSIIKDNWGASDLAKKQIHKAIEHKLTLANFDGPIYTMSWNPKKSADGH